MIARAEIVFANWLNDAIKCSDYYWQFVMGEKLVSNQFVHRAKCTMAILNNSFCFNLLFAGPVVFPEPPADGPVESSGVIIGGSGFGFVPPNGPPQQSNYFN